ncbi:MAG: prepilin-type N-terminal cleavage/methylation domain-containing protein [Gemmataceae bacterium]|nr:prepilin-type N-terminal cleavage/methylation domain-containing protein [Gemmataceae bacterium]
MKSCPRVRFALTMIEVLVTISVVGMLTGFLLVGVQSV